jgi:BirA family biotin operon repressor/biotin-[acetyl-CoA-carboxylase] ligase
MSVATAVDTVPGEALRAAFAAPLRVPAIAAAAAGAIGAADIAALLDTGSTNTDLLGEARQGAQAAPRLRTALKQNAGRGRFGRRWHAAPGAALLFSLAVPLGDAMAPAAATLAAGVALAETLEAALREPGDSDAGRIDLRLKWPNDLLLDGRKLGGVLAELAVDRAGRRTLVVGVGINLWLDAAARGSIDQPAAALAELQPLPALLAQREALLGRLATALLQAVREVTAQGFVPWQPRFMRRFALLGQTVRIVEHGACVADGRALGVDGDGRLLVDRGGRVTAFASGEVSVRAGATGERA